MTDTRWGRFVIACLAAQVAVYLLYALDVDVFGVQAHNVDWYLENEDWWRALQDRDGVGKRLGNG